MRPPQAPAPGSPAADGAKAKPRVAVNWPLLACAAAVAAFGFWALNHTAAGQQLAAAVGGLIQAVRVALLPV